MKTLGRLFLLAFVLCLLGALVFYKRPLWAKRQQVHFGLFLAHVQSDYVMTPEGRVHYYDAESTVPGGGIPLVLVHGLGDRSESWAPMLKRLRKAGFHVYAPDLLGYGRSPQPADSDYSIATQEKFVADFIQSLGLQTTDVGGWSMGGWVALKLALDHPEMVDRVVVYDSVGIGFTTTQTPDLFLPKTGADVDRLVAMLEPGEKRLPAFVKRDVLREVPDVQNAVSRGLQSMTTTGPLLDDRLPALKQPLLILWGAEDRLVPLDVGRKMHALDPQSELDILEGCGHLAPLGCSARAAAATADFLRSNPAPAGSVRVLTSMK